MKILFFIIAFALFSYLSVAQTVIEMMYPGDATVILLEVNKVKDADIIVYKTESREEANEWDCKWKFKSWGFSNFSVYLTQDDNDSLLFDYETGEKLGVSGKIFFTDDPDNRGYTNPDFRLEGVFRKINPADVDW